MNKIPCRIIAPVFAIIFFLDAINAQVVYKDSVKYVPRQTYPVTDEIKDINKKINKEKQTVTDSIRNVQSLANKKEQKERKEIRFNLTRVQKPKSLDVFKSVFHFEPVAQFLTGTCWSFSTTSFFESEVYRITGKKIKLSEMYTVYYHYLERARRYVAERGNSLFQEGGEGNSVILVWQEYGIVPAEIYKGELSPDGRYDHSKMVSDMKGYLEYIKDNELWDEGLVISSLRLIMDKYMGRPPNIFKYKGKTITPRDFLNNILELKLEDYICAMSTLSKPFYKYGVYEVKGNWWRSSDYYNLPLDQFYEIVKYAIQNGYSVRLNGDVFEPGHNGFEDVALIPTFDIPREYIDQNAREFRFFNKSTTDDHDIHLVGYIRINDYDWYLIKDSAEFSEFGKYNGYFFYREDYIKLKMLTYIVHKDAVKAMIGNFLK